MTPENILDTPSGQNIRDHLFQHEKIAWEGAPSPRFSITLLETQGYYDVRGGPMSILGLLLGSILIGVYQFYRDGNWIGVILAPVIGIILILLPDVLKHLRKQHTKYAFTQERVFFQLWRWGKTRIYWIDLADVGKVTYEEYADKSGVLHFLPKTQFDFFTHDFVTGKKRFYPTFEMVSDVVELQKRLEDLRIARVSGNAH